MSNPPVVASAITGGSYLCEDCDKDTFERCAGMYLAMKCKAAPMCKCGKQSLEVFWEEAG